MSALGRFAVFVLAENIAFPEKQLQSIFPDACSKSDIIALLELSWYNLAVPAVRRKEDFIMPRSNTRKSAAGIGTIRKKTVTRNGKDYTFWEARYTVGFDPGTGKQVQRSISGKTQKEVRQKLQTATSSIAAGTYIAPCKMTLGEWLESRVSRWCKAIDDQGLQQPYQCAHQACFGRCSIGRIRAAYDSEVLQYNE